MRKINFIQVYNIKFKLELKDNLNNELNIKQVKQETVHKGESTNMRHLTLSNNNLTQNPKNQLNQETVYQKNDIIPKTNPNLVKIFGGNTKYDQDNNMKVDSLTSLENIFFTDRSNTNQIIQNPKVNKLNNIPTTNEQKLPDTKLLVRIIY